MPLLIRWACIGFDDMEPLVSPTFKLLGLVPYAPPPWRSASTGRVRDALLVVSRVELYIGEKECAAL
jgi:hypothetical protein